MNIARKKDVKVIGMGDSMTVYEYPMIDKAIHGAVVEIDGRYPEHGRVMNEICYEMGYVIKGSGKLVIEGQEILFEQGDQLLIKPGQKYFWKAKATMYMPCAPAWYYEQHKEVE